jgi:aldose sugar dehydrogenase
LEDDPLLSDLVADNDEEMSAVTLGTGFVGITDIETGLDGNLYILTFDRGAEGEGSLYRIFPAVQEGTTTSAAGDAISPPDVIPPPAVEDEDEEDSEQQDGPDQDEEYENDDINGEE